jgi:hypothetical protein
VQGRAFPNQIVVADDEAAGLVFELHVLRQPSQHSVLGYSIPPAQGRELFDDDMRSDFASFADHHIVFDDNVWPDPRIRSDSGAGAGDGCRMNTHKYIVNRES